MDFKTMQKEEVLREDLNKKIFVIQGDLIDENFWRVPEEIEGYVLVTGNVTFKSNHTIRCGLIVLGNLDACRVYLHGDLHVYGNPPKAERLIVHGNLVAKPGDHIKESFFVGERIFC